MRRIRQLICLGKVLVAVLLILSGTADAQTTDPPATPVKLIFIHHSCGGNWLADETPDIPSGGLGAALMNNNYYVSATNYDWGPDGIGTRTDIPNWPEWFTGTNSGTILAALYAETGQTLYSPGDWRYRTHGPAWPLTRAEKTKSSSSNPVSPTPIFMAIQTTRRCLRPTINTPWPTPRRFTTIC